MNEKIKQSRRAFLKGGLALSAVGLAPAVLAPAVQAKSDATTASWISGDITFSDLRGRTWRSGCSPTTSAPMVAGRSLLLNSPSERTPLRR